MATRVPYLHLPDREWLYGPTPSPRRSREHTADRGDGVPRHRRFASPDEKTPPGRRRRASPNAGGDSGWVAVADQVEARLLLATTAQFVRCTVVLRGGSSEVRRSPRDVVVGGAGRRRRPHGGVLPRFSVERRGINLRARSAAGSDAIRAARPSLRAYSAVDAGINGAGFK